jgi:hypothetical protein
MNCKPGDLAVIVASPWAPENVGKIVAVLRPYREREVVAGVCWNVVSAGQSWVVESTGSDLAWGVPGRTKAGRSRQRVYADVCLRPIRDPGDDARDETLDWLPVPAEDVITFTSGWDPRHYGSDA